MTENIDEIAQAVALNLATKGYIQNTQKRKPRVNWESKMAREYGVSRWMRNLKWYRHEVGPFDPNNVAYTYSQLRRWADLIVDDDDKIRIYEIKMRPDQRAVSQIDLYKQLFIQTPEFEYYWDKPVTGILLTTELDESIAIQCKRWDIEYEVFEPSFIAEYRQVLRDRYAKK